MENAAQRRIMGIDYGSVRIGIAVSDPLRLMASSYAVLPNDKSLWDELTKILDSENVEFVVVGMPVNLKGERGQKAREVESFIEELKKRSRLEVVSWDERFTTTIANQSILARGTKKKDRKASRKRIDATAAAVMLQGFLDRTKKSMSC